MTEVCHRAKTLLYFVEISDVIAWKGRQIQFSDWEKIAEEFGFKPDNYYTPAGKMFSEKLISNEDGRISGTFAGIMGIRTH